MKKDLRRPASDALIYLVENEIFTLLLDHLINFFQKYVFPTQDCIDFSFIQVNSYGLFDLIKAERFDFLNKFLGKSAEC